MAFFLRVLRLLVEGGGSNQTSANRLWAASFAFLNVLIVELIFLWYPEAKRPLLIPYSLLLCLLLVVLGMQTLPSLGRQALEGLRASQVPVQVPLFLGTVALLINAVRGIGAAFIVNQGLHSAEIAVAVFLLLALIECVDLRTAELLGRESIFSIYDLVPSVRKHGAAEDSHLDELQIRDRVRLNKGDIVPSDSIVVEGYGDVWERRHDFSGERQLKFPGDEIYAGTEIFKGPLTIEIRSPASSSDITGYFDKMSSAISTEEPKLRRFVYCSSAINVACAAAGIGGALYWLGARLPFADISDVVVSVCFLALLSQSCLFARETFRGAYSKACRFGAFAGAPWRTFDAARRVMQFVIDMSIADPPGIHAIGKLTLLDERVGEAGVYSALLSLLSLSSKRLHSELAMSAASNCAHCRLEPVQDWGLLDEDGVSGVIQGVRFYVGKESVLIASGVEFGVSDSLDNDQNVFFVACGTLNVARFTVTGPLVSEGEFFQSALLRDRIRLHILSNDDPSEVDRIGKQIGMELAAITGGLNSETFQDRLATLRPLALLTNRSTPKECSAKADVTFSYFDYRLFSFTSADVVILGRSLAGILDLIQISRAEALLRKTLMLGGLGLGVASFALAVTLVFSPLIVLSILLGWSTAQLVLIARFTSMTPAKRPLSARA